MPESYFLQFLGGMALFFYGFISTKSGLKSFAGDRFKTMITRGIKTRFHGILTGALVTFFLQSSAATTILLVGLGNSGLVGLRQAMSVMLGAGIGTTLVVLLMTFHHMANDGLMIILAGFVTSLIFRQRHGQFIAQVIMGLGFIFFGLDVMTNGMAPLSKNALVNQVFIALTAFPYQSFLVAALITALLTSSALVLGISISLAFSGLLDYQHAVPIVLGANVGTCISGIFVSMSGPAMGKRIAVANLLLKLISAGVLMPFLPQVAAFSAQAFDSLSLALFERAPAVHSEIALAHLAFNIFMAVVFLPFLHWGEKLATLIVPQGPADKEPFGAKYLDKNALATPSLAFAQATREVLRIGDIVRGMHADCLRGLETNIPGLTESIETRDDQVDMIDRDIKFYLAKLSLSELTESQARMELHLITATNNLENIGDVIGTSVVKLIRKKWSTGCDFSPDGWSEIKEYHGKVLENFDLAFSALTTGSEEICRSLIRHQVHLAEWEEHLKQSHLARLHEGIRDTQETTSMHLDLLANFRRINFYLTGVVKYIAPDEARKVAEII